MIPIDQTVVVHDPENGQYGNCHRACIASILECSIDALEPWEHHYEDGIVFMAECRRSLANVGVAIMQFPCSGYLAGVLNMMAVYNPDIYYTLSGLGARGHNHCVVAKGGKIVHDPHPSRTGLIGPMVNDDPDAPRIFLIEVMDSIMTRNDHG